MAKIFNSVILIAAAVAFFFGLQSKNLVGKLQVAAEREHADHLTAEEKKKKAEKETTAAKEELTAVKDELPKAKEMLAKAEEKQKTAETELTTAKTESEGVKTELEAAKKNLADLKVVMGDKEPAEIVKRVAEMETATKDATAKVANLENEVATQKTVIETLTVQKKNSEGKLASQSKTIDRYVNNIMLKGTRGQVLAVNYGWGFCVVSIGDRKGAAASKVLIVVRNGQSIGKVKIISVESSQSVADIIPSSFARGTYVEAGDEVIFTGDDKVREEPAAAATAAPSPAGNALGLPVLPQH